MSDPDDFKIEMDPGIAKWLIVGITVVLMGWMGTCAYEAHEHRMAQSACASAGLDWESGGCTKSFH